MTDEERAEWLARAIDRLLTERPVPAPAGLGAEEMEALIRVAKARLAAGQAGAQAALHHESAVWQQVLARLQERRQHAASAEARAKRPSPAEPAQGEARELRHIVALRKQLADDMTALAERHRENVWQELQSRILSAGREQTPLPFLRPSPALAGGQRDSELEAVLASVHGDPRLMGAAPGLWTRLRRAVSGWFAPPQTRRAANAPPWPRLATVAAAVALIIAAVGPLPSTGLAGHPAVRAARSLGEIVGVTETASMPDAPGEGTVVQGQDMGAAQASALMGLPLLGPEKVPGDYTFALSRFYSEPLTGEQPGLFVLGFSRDDGSTLLIYQEAASGNDLATFPGSVTAVTLADSTPATYFEGSWQAADGRVFWSEANSRSLVFDRAGVRTIIRYIGERGDAVTLVSLAGALLAPAR